MSKHRSFISIFIPSATVFISSSCIMVLELVAARLIAKHLGSSLYTWTAVIGVVLSGITIGNYLGGRIADRHEARKALAILFTISSAACVATVILNNLVGGLIWLWYLSWPLRVFVHVVLVFFIPSTMLGTISPVVAKMALDQGLPTGRTVGDIYAWGAAGSIAGTFAAGYYLIATMGNIAIIWTIGGTLLLMAILYWARFWPVYIWAAIFASALTMGIAPADWAKDTGSNLGLRKKPNPEFIYEDETPYCHITVKRISERPDRRVFIQDKLKHSDIIMGDIDNLQYFYTRIYAVITHGLSRDKEKLNVMAIGGGGYVYPRYIEKNWPGSHIDVVEIDPGVTKAAIAAFGLDPNTLIKTFTMDARNYVDELLEKKRSGTQVPQYDFIYEDAINDYSVPYQLVTREFNDKIAQILADDGVYMVNLIDIYDIGQFLGSIVNTLEQTFSNVYVLSAIAKHNIRNTFIVAAANQEIDIEKILEQHSKGINIWYLDDTEIAMLRQKSRGIVLTDDYAPVENMLAPVVHLSSIELLTEKFREQARELKQEGKPEQAIAKYKELIEIDPTMSILAFNEIAMMRAQQGRLNDAVEAFEAAIEYNEQAEDKINAAGIHLNLGLALKELKQSKEAENHFQQAIKVFKKELSKNPKSPEAAFRLANALAEKGDFKQAAKYFQRAIDLNPYDVTNHYALSKVLEAQGRYNEAISVLQKASEFMNYIGQKEDAAKLNEQVELLKFKKSQSKK